MKTSAADFPKSRKREYVLAVAATAIGALLALVILEVFFQKDNSAIRFDSELGWANKPNLSAVIDDKKHTTNSLGLRAPEIDPSKDHILIVGDSVTWGVGVNDDETLAYFLNQKYAEYQTLNFGVNGYGLDQYYLHLKRHIAKTNPRFIIVVIFTGNDVGDTTTDISYGKSKPLYVVDRSKVTLAPGREYTVNPANLMLTNSNISPYSCANLTTARPWGRWSLNFSCLTGIFCSQHMLDDMETQYVIMATLMKIGELARQHNAGLLFVLSPYKWDFLPPGSVKAVGKTSAGLVPGHLEYFRDIFRQMEFRYMDHFEEIQKRKLGVDGLYFDDIHYSAAGNQALAEAIFEYIETRSSIRKPVR